MVHRGMMLLPGISATPEHSAPLRLRFGQYSAPLRLRFGWHSAPLRLRVGWDANCVDRYTGTLEAYGAGLTHHRKEMAAPRRSAVLAAGFLGLSSHPEQRANGYSVSRQK